MKNKPCFEDGVSKAILRDLRDLSQAKCVMAGFPSGECTELLHVLECNFWCKRFGIQGNLIYIFICRYFFGKILVIQVTSIKEQ